MKNPAIHIHILGTVICTLIVVGAVAFAGNSIKERRGVFLNARQELANVQVKQHQSMTDRAELASFVEESQRKAQAYIKLDPIETMNRRMVSIVEIAESNGVQVDSFQHEHMLADSQVPVQPFILSGGADADNAHAFIQALGDQMPDIHIQSMSLTGVSYETSRVHLELQMYWFVDPASGV